MSRFRAEAALLLAALLYGVTFPMVKEALEDITPYAYLVGRFTVASVLLIPPVVVTWRRRLPPGARRTMLRSGVIAGGILFLGYVTQTVGLQHTTASTSAFVTGLYVVMTPVLEALVHRRLPARVVVVGLVLATFGLALLTDVSLDIGIGVWLTLLCAVLFAAHIVYIGAYARLDPLMPFTTVQLSAVAVLCIPPTAIDGVGTVTAYAVFAVVFTGIACSALALPLQVWGQRRIPATRAALVLLAEPVFAGVASWIAGERLSATQLVGGAVILVGIAVSEVGTRSRDDAPMLKGTERTRWPEPGTAERRRGSGNGGQR